MEKLRVRPLAEATLTAKPEHCPWWCEFYRDGVCTAPSAPSDDAKETCAALCPKVEVKEE